MGRIVSFNELEEKVLELYTKGYSKDLIALELNIPIDEVKKIFRKPKVREKMQEIIEFREVMLKEKHIEILDELTEKMLEASEGDITKLLGKGRDILDIIAVTNQIMKEQEKKRLGTNENNVIVQILNQLSGGSDDGKE
jgi:orotate phosphoribosyltransferase-like protein